MRWPLSQGQNHLPKLLNHELCEAISWAKGERRDQ